MERITSPEFNAEIRTWLPVDEIEPGALAQLHNAACHPEVADVVAVMPDCHVGYGVTIGCVFPTVNAVVPNAVGVDIGCGMSAINTGVQYDRAKMDRTFWRSWAGRVVRDVPNGFNVHKSPQKLGHLDRELRAKPLRSLVAQKAAVQLGTLGGGNHFLEAQVDEQNFIWLMVHSGSRHTGLRIADHYHKLAIAHSKTRGLEVRDDLASLPVDDQTGQDYLADMEWATDFALASRKQMTERMLAAFQRASGEDVPARGSRDERFINIHHNFANLEIHDDKTLMVHRKGATSAFLNQLGIIPGSMGSPSYIVRGLGNDLSLMSCSHGAGRQMGRKSAKEAISEADFAASISGTYSKASMSYVDEAPGAYKDIEIVISRQQDLIEIVHTLTPIITIKGDSRAKED